MKCLLILDRYGYRVNDTKYKKILAERYQENEIMYTKYEDEMIRIVRNWPIVGNFLLHILRWKKSIGYALYAMKHKDIDKIISLNPIVGILIGLLCSNKNNVKLVVCGFLFEEKKNRIYYYIRKMLTKQALKRISKVVVYGRTEVAYYEQLFNIKGKFEFVEYGIDYMNQSEYNLQELPRGYVFSGGGSNRDYSTLINAYNNNNELDLPLVIATQPWRLNGMDISKCIVLSNVVNETFGDVMHKSILLVLSLKNTTISAGHMVMLQAMSLGVPVLVNDIPAIRDYADERAVKFYESGNVKELSSIIASYLVSEERQEKAYYAKQLYYDKYTSFSLIERLICL